MNAFERHGIKHLSASSLNSFAAEPALWCMERLLKKWGATGSVAFRGQAIEDGVTHGLKNPGAPIEECQKIALASFDKRAALSADPRRMKHREAVSPTVERALGELRQYGIPDRIQDSVLINIPGIPVPIKGIIDYGWTEHGIILDLKTSDRLPSAISAAHARQGCIYVFGTNQQMRFSYVTPAKIGVYALEEPNKHIEALRQIANRLERFLSISDDPEFLTGLLAPNYDDFRWNDPRQRAVGREVFGF